MTDKELADAVVALGVADEKHPPQLYRLGNKYQMGYFGWTRADNFVRDWRVAGALMEKVEQLEYHWFAPVPPGGWWSVIVGPDGEEGKNDNLPRAIIEACVQALAD